jgi:hypothetical protein
MRKYLKIGKYVEYLMPVSSEYLISCKHCVRTILTTFYHMHRYHYAATGDMVKFHLYFKLHAPSPPHMLLLNSIPCQRR